MSSPSLDERVLALELTVNGPGGLSMRVEELGQQILSLRGEMRAGFSSIHDAIVATNVRIDRVEARLDHMDARFDRIDGEHRTSFAALELKIEKGDEEIRRVMRILHEDLVARITTIGEARNGRRSRKPRKKS